MVVGEVVIVVVVDVDDLEDMEVSVDGDGEVTGWVGVLRKDDGSIFSL